MVALLCQNGTPTEMTKLGLFYSKHFSVVHVRDLTKDKREGDLPQSQKIFHYD